MSDRDIKKAYKSVKGRIPGTTEEMPYDIINNVTKTLPTDRGFKTIIRALDSNEHQVIGHKMSRMQESI